MCPGNPDALGTDRVLSVDPLEHRRIGKMEYKETLPLNDHEAVLTFDDGPLAPNTTRILDALAAECVKATFFVVGSMANAAPDLVKRIHDDGHTIGTHTLHHMHMTHLSREAVKKEILAGIASVRVAAGSNDAVAPFFRFPYLEDNREVDGIALEQGLMIWSIDFAADDWSKSYGRR
jgi:peptidoglycan/xylan/chitin deacetylase (PgdA/CDA1 family)